MPNGFATDLNTPLSQDQARSAILETYGAPDDGQVGNAPAPEQPTDPKSFFDSLPDAHDDQHLAAPTAAEPKIDPKAAGDFWNSLPDAPPEPVKENIGTMTDIGRSVASGAAKTATGFAVNPIGFLTNMAKAPVEGLTRLGGAAYEGLGSELSPGAAHYLTYPLGDGTDAISILQNQIIPAAVKNYTGMDMNYEPKTGLGEASQIATEALPYMVGGESEIIKTGVKALMSGLGDVGAKSAAKNLGFGEKWQEVAGDLGALGGFSAPDIRVKGFKQNTQTGRSDVLGGEMKDMITPQEMIDAQAIAQRNPSATLQELFPNNPKVAEYQQNVLAKAQQSGNTALTGKIDEARQGNADDFKQYTDSVAPNANPYDIGRTFTQQLQDADDAAAKSEAGSSKLSKTVEPTLSTQEIDQRIYDSGKTNTGTARTEYKDLWDSLNKYDAAPFDTTEMQKQVEQANANLKPKGGEKFTPEETEVHNLVASGAKEGATFGDIRALRANINEKIQQAGQKYGFKTAAVVRLQDLKKSLDRAIDSNLDNVNSYESEQVASGHMAPEDTVAHAFYQDAIKWYGDRHAAQQTASGGASPKIPKGLVDIGSERVFGSSGAKGAQTGGFPNAAGGTGVPKNTGEPLTKAAQQTYQEYNQKRTQFGKTFGDKTIIGKILKNAEPQIGNTASRFFVRGEKGATAIKEYKAAGLDPKDLEQYALNKFAGKVLDKKTGNINPDALRREMAAHQGALSEMPELQKKLSNVSDAQEALDNARRDSYQKAQDVKKSVAKDFIGMHDPSKSMAGLFNGKNPAGKINDLMQRVKNNPDAVEGVKRLTIQHMVEKFGKEGQEAKLAEFVKNNRQALKSIFTGQGLQELERAVNDYSGGAKALPREVKQTSVASWLEKLQQKHPQLVPIVEAGIGTKGISHAAQTAKTHPVLASVAAVGAIAKAIRTAGMKKMLELRLETVLNPNTDMGLLYKKFSSNQQPPVPVLRKIGASVLGLTQPELPQHNKKDGEKDAN